MLSGKIINHILLWKYFLKQVNEGEIEGRI